MRGADGFPARLLTNGHGSGPQSSPAGTAKTREETLIESERQIAIEAMQVQHERQQVRWTVVQFQAQRHTACGCRQLTLLRA